MRGASYLAGIDLEKQERSGKSVIVVDVGGTTTDVGVLLPSGFPRQAAAFIKGDSLNLNVTFRTFFIFSSCWSQDKVLIFVSLMWNGRLIIFCQFFDAGCPFNWLGRRITSST